jgi:DNA-binding PadR family transcriptional regulator
MTIRHALLALLADGPKHGFQLANGFEAGTGEMWPLNTGQVYTTLQRLARDGMVAAAHGVGDEPDEGASNLFQLTEAGHTELFDWLRTPPDLSIPPRDELVIKVLVALRVPGVDIAELTQIHRGRLIEMMHEYTTLKQHASEDDIGLLLVADAEIFRLEALVRWLDAADTRIKRLPTPLPLPTAAPGRRPVRRKTGARR